MSELVNFQLLALYESIPEFMGIYDTDIVSALNYLRDLCCVAKDIPGFEKSLLDMTLHEESIKKDKRKKTAMRICHDILFGPLEDVPAYISVPGYDILVKFRLMLANKKADSPEETSPE